jgi:non-ribosomal peptide synthetase component F
MTTGLGEDRVHWREVLAAGGFTTIPRWTLNPVPGFAERQAPIPAGVVAGIRRLAEELGVPLSSVLLAAHAKVLAALSGEDEVRTGYVAEAGGQPLPCQLSTEPASWRELIQCTALRTELGIAEPPFETVFDPTGAAGQLAGDTVLWVGVSADEQVLRLRYRTDVLDSDGARRIIGYHLTALTLIHTDADARHLGQSLLSAEELHLQLEGLAGPPVELPDLRCHELFQQRVAEHPDAIAAV